MTGYDIASVVEEAEARYRDGQQPEPEIHGAGGRAPAWVRLGEVRCGRMEGGRFAVERVERQGRAPSASGPLAEWPRANLRPVVVGGVRYGSAREAARALGASPSTVSQRVRRGATVDGLSYGYAPAGEEGRWRAI